MKRQVKRILRVVLCGVLTVGSLAGCGKKNAESALKNGIKTLNDAKNMEADVEMSGTLSVEAAGQKQDMNMAVHMAETLFMDPMKMKITVETTMMGETTSVASYIAKEGDDYYSYSGLPGGWIKTKIGDLEDAVNQAGADINKILPDLSKIKYTQKENQKEDDKEYYVFEYAITGEAVKNMCEGAMGSAGSMESLFPQGQDTEEVLKKIFDSIGTVTMTIWVDPEKETVYKVVCPMTDIMNRVFEALIESIGSSEELDGTDLSQFKMSVSDMNMTMKYTNVGSAEDFDVPEEALEAEEMDLDDLMESGAESEE